MIARAMGRTTITAINKIIDFVVLTGIVLLLTFSGYALWDSEQIHHAADKSHYAVYRPTIVDEGKSFQELRDINPEVFSWLSVYGTNIEYPVAQGRNNLKYVNTNAEGEYSLSGAIFMDSANSQGFDDFNSILYGHHMEKKTMFGEIGDFSDRAFFEARRYGNIHSGGRDMGIEFFAFVHTDAYDHATFSPNIAEGGRQAYLDGLLSKSIYTRDIGVTADDRIVLLSTCSSDSTNGRDILIGRLSDGAFDDPFYAEDDGDGNRIVVSRAMFDKAISSLPQHMISVSASLMAACALILALHYVAQKRKAKKANKMIDANKANEIGATDAVSAASNDASDNASYITNNTNNNLTESEQGSYEKNITGNEV